MISRLRWEIGARIIEHCRRWRRGQNLAASGAKEQMISDSSILDLFSFMIARTMHLPRITPELDGLIDLGCKTQWKTVLLSKYRLCVIRMLRAATLWSSNQTYLRTNSFSSSSVVQRLMTFLAITVLSEPGFQSQFWGSPLYPCLKTLFFSRNIKVIVTYCYEVGFYYSQIYYYIIKVAQSFSRLLALKRYFSRKLGTTRW